MTDSHCYPNCRDDKQSYYRYRNFFIFLCHILLVLVFIVADMPVGKQKVFLSGPFPECPRKPGMNFVKITHNFYVIRFDALLNIA